MPPRTCIFIPLGGTITTPGREQRLVVPHQAGNIHHGKDKQNCAANIIIKLALRKNISRPLANMTRMADVAQRAMLVPSP